MATFARIISRAQGLIGEVAGPGVQVFAEDRQLKDAIASFNMIFIKYGWPEYTRWSRHELDGSTGLVTDSNLANVRNFTDFLRVTRDGEDRSISILPSRTNPYTLSSTARVQYFSSLAASHASFAAKKLQFWPVTSEGFVNVRARIYPVTSTQEIVPTTEVKIDEDLLVFATAFFTLGFEDLNAGAADICKNLMEGRFRDIMAAYANHDSELTPGANQFTDWTTVP